MDALAIVFSIIYVAILVCGLWAAVSSATALIRLMTRIASSLESIEQSLQTRA